MTTQARIAALETEVARLEAKLREVRGNYQKCRRRLRQAWRVIRAAGCGPQYRRVVKLGAQLH